MSLYRLKERALLLDDATILLGDISTTGYKSTEVEIVNKSDIEKMAGIAGLKIYVAPLTRFGLTLELRALVNLVSQMPCIYLAAGWDEDAARDLLSIMNLPAFGIVASNKRIFKLQKERHRWALNLEGRC